MFSSINLTLEYGNFLHIVTLDRWIELLFNNMAEYRSKNRLGGMVVMVEVHCFGVHGK
jgi:hypothetical protein